MFLDKLLAAIPNRLAKMSRVAVFKKLRDEREYQQSRWDPTKSEAADEEYGTCLTVLNDLGQFPKLERYHELGAWISFMETYLEEARDINSKSDDKNAALLKVLAVGALAVACLEQHGCPDRPAPKTDVPVNEGATFPDKPVMPNKDAAFSPAYHGERPNGCPNKANCPVHMDGGFLDQLKAAGLVR